MTWLGSLSRDSYEVVIKVRIRAVVSYEGAIRGRSTLKLTDLALGQFSST